MKGSDGSPAPPHEELRSYCTRLDCGVVICLFVFSICIHVIAPMEWLWILSPPVSKSDTTTFVWGRKEVVIGHQTSCIPFILALS